MPPSPSSPRSLSIGGATEDLFVEIDDTFVREDSDGKAFRFSLGEKIRVKDIQGLCGGGAANTAVGLGRLGFRSVFCGVVGDDQWGNHLLSELNKAGVDTSAATMVEGETSSCALIFLDHEGERTILVHRGTNIHLHDVTFDRRCAAEMDIIYLNHLPPSGTVINDDIVAIAKSGKTHLTWNPGGSQIAAGITTKENRALLAVTHLLILNKEEALRFTQTRTTEEAMTKLIEAGARIVCVTDGPRGTIARDGEATYICPSLPVTVVDATGAGDAFGVGMTWALGQGKDLPTALRAGTINAASVIGVLGAQTGLLTAEQMNDRLRETSLTVERTSC
jgi:fructokinase